MNVWSEISQQWDSLVCVFVACLLVLIMKKVADSLTPFDDRAEIEDKGNFAVSLRQAGLFIGLALALIGPLTGPSEGWIRDGGLVFIEGLVAIVLLAGAALVNEHLILPRIDNNEALKNNNTAVGIVEFGSLIATGLIAGGCFAGEGGSFWGSLGYSIVFFLIGQTILVISAWVASAVFNFDTTYQIEQGNQAAAIFYASWLVSMGIILGESLKGPSNGFVFDLMAFGFYTVLGMVLLVAGTLAADHFMLPKTKIGYAIEKQANAASATLMSAPMIVIALIVAASVL